MIFKTMLTVFTLTLFLTACPSEKKVGPEQVIESIVSAMCKKMATCQPNAMSSEEFCRDTMKTALSGHEAIAKIQITKKQLDACVTTIEGSECEGLLGATPPKGCEFLQ
jgi:hypothetical protein